jgi:hypothetical protein
MNDRKFTPDGHLIGPPDEVTLPEPPIGSVLRYKIDHGGRLYTYVSMRAETGLWYTTGGGSQRVATWAELFTALKEKLRGPVELLVPHSIIWRS